jgi:hypothetical protein
VPEEYLILGQDRVTICGLVVSMLAIGSKVCGFKPGHYDRCARAIKIRDTTFIGGEVKPSVSCRKILRHVKKRYEYERDILLAKFIVHFFAKSLLLCY